MVGAVDVLFILAGALKEAVHSTLFFKKRMDPKLSEEGQHETPLELFFHSKRLQPLCVDWLSHCCL